MVHQGHPIGVAAKRTGISTHLIRMWERRYSAVSPERTDTGRRLYTDEEIERLTLLHRATVEGQSIGSIAGLPNEQLRELVGTQTLALDEAVGRPVDAEQHIKLCLQAMQNLDAGNLEVHLLRASVTLGQRAFLEQMLHPLLERTGEMWSNGALRVVHEHLASAVIRSLLGSINTSMSNLASAPLLLSTTPVGQQHEFGALMASVTAAAAGWRTIYLGANMPAEDIVEAANSSGAAAIALSLVYSDDDHRIPSELRKMTQMTAGKIPVLVGGRSALSYQGVIEEIGAYRITSLEDLRVKLEEIGGGGPGSSRKLAQS